MGQTPAVAANAYNSYNWPIPEGTAGQQLTIASTGSGIATLAWDDPDRIPWTAKGQLVVGTGLSTETLLNVGANGSILIADSTQTSGLNYTANYVSGITAGTGLSTSGSTGNVTLTNAGVTQLAAGTNVSISGSTGNVTISAVPGGAIGTITGVTAGTGLSGGGVSGNVTLANTGVTFLVASTGLSGSGTTGSVTLTNTGVTSLIAGTNITLSGSTGSITISASGGGGGTGTVTSVDVSGGSTGLTSSGGPVTSSGTITLGGTLALANGGTGATTQAGAINNLLPAQSGNAGDYLTTDGSNVSWSTTSATDIPSGTIMLFMQAAAPTGWTQVTTQNNVGIRIVNTAGGGTGGTVPFSTLFGPTSTYTGSLNITSGQVGDTTLTEAQLASHSHYMGNVCTWQGGIETSPPAGNNYNNSQPYTATAGSSASHTHSLIGVVAGGNFTTNLDLQYVDVIAASKN